MGIGFTSVTLTFGNDVGSPGGGRGLSTGGRVSTIWGGPSLITVPI